LNLIFTLAEALGNRFTQFQLAAKGTGNALSPCMAISQSLAICSCVAPCFCHAAIQRAIMKVNIQPVIGTRQDLHFKNHSGRQSKKRFLQPFKAFCAGFGSQLIALKATASHNGRFRKVFSAYASLLGLINQEIQPGGSVLQQFPYCLNKLIFNLRFIFDFHHFLFYYGEIPYRLFSAACPTGCFLFYTAYLK
jgi:hypothetical protein